MDVHVRNVPKQVTADVLNSALKSHFRALSIRSINWSKPKMQNYAFLTFLHIEDAEKFLKKHGSDQVGKQSGQKSTFQQLYMNGNTPLYFRKSRNPPQELTIRGLLKEEKDRQNDADQPDATHKYVKFEPVIFRITALTCGSWSSHLEEVVFAPQTDWQGFGTAKFGQRSMVLTLDSGKRVDFRYNGVLEIITQNSPASIILSMHEPPRFFDTITSHLENMFQLLSLPGQAKSQGMKVAGHKRQRLSALDDNHALLAGNCLVYKLTLPYVTRHNSHTEDFQRLSRISSIPQIFSRFVREWRLGEPHARMVRILDQVLSSMTTGIPFEVGFQVKRLVTNNYLPPSIVIDLLPEIVTMIKRSGSSITSFAIRKLFIQIDYPSHGTDAEQYSVKYLEEMLRQNEESSIKETELTVPAKDFTGFGNHYTADSFTNTGPSSNEVMIYRVKITPAGMILSGPELEASNRVLRKYSTHQDYFLRVCFCDEDASPVRQSFKVSTEKIFKESFRDVLCKGLQIADRHYDFLGFSHSSLRMQTCWFMAPFIFEGSLLHDRLVIRDLGNFANITCPAKCAARIGQAFSDTPVTIEIGEHEVIDDVERNGRVYSDGVGTISRDLMERLYDRLKRKTRIKPTCFQIRYQGAKGMVALDSRLEGEVINLRPSMIKFEGSTSTDLEICESAYKPLPLFLNRQLIKILEDMGVSDDFFLRLQEEEVERLRMITKHPLDASTFLKRQKIGDTVHLPSLILQLVLIDLDFREDGFLRDVIEVAMLFELRQLKHKTRIPVAKGWHLHGIMDETGFLEEGEIFCIVNVEGKTQVVEGTNLIVSRSPALHPGDAQLVNAVAPPAGSPLWNLVNCICFSQKGTRDLPSQLGGGDLDGDRFCIIFDEEAVAKRSFPPADYPRQEPMNIGRVVTKEDIVDFFIQFMESDQLGRIAVSHRIQADIEDEGTLHPICIDLAEMHSTAVDFSKTGVPVDMSKFRAQPRWRPDFEASGPHITIENLDGVSLKDLKMVDPQDQEDEDDDMPRYRYYESDKILGKLYRAIDERKIFAEIRHREQQITSQSTVIDAVWDYIKTECKLIEWKHLRDWALEIRQMYEDHFLSIMIEYSDHPSRPLSELEVFVGNILGKTGAQTRLQHDTSTKMKERVDQLNQFIVNSILRSDEEGGTRSSEALERTMACLAVSLQGNEHGQKKQKKRIQPLSFKYVAAALCLEEVERFRYGL